MVRAEPTPIGYTIKETPKVFKEDWGKYAEDIAAFDYSRFLSSLHLLPLRISKMTGQVGKITQGEFALSHLLGLPEDDQITVSKYNGADGAVCYAFYDLDIGKAKRQLTIKFTEGNSSCQVVLESNEKPEIFDPGNINYADRVMSVSLDSKTKTIHTVTDQRFVTNRNGVGRYEVHGISYIYRREGEDLSVISLVPGKVVGRTSSHVDQETTNLPDKRYCKWNRGVDGYDIENIIMLATAHYPVNWLTENLPPDRSILKIPVEKFTPHGTLTA